MPTPEKWNDPEYRARLRRFAEYRSLKPKKDESQAQAIPGRKDGEDK